MKDSLTDDTNFLLDKNQENKDDNTHKSKAVQIRQLVKRTLTSKK